MSHSSVHPLSQSSQYDFSKSSNTAADSGPPNPNVTDDSSSRTQEIPIYDGASVQRRNFALSPPLSSSPPLTSASSSTESAGKHHLTIKHIHKTLIKITELDSTSLGFITIRLLLLLLLLLQQSQSTPSCLFPGSNKPYPALDLHSHKLLAKWSNINTTLNTLKTQLFIREFTA